MRVCTNSSFSEIASSRAGAENRVSGTHHTHLLTPRSASLDRVPDEERRTCGTCANRSPDWVRRVSAAGDVLATGDGDGLDA
jgi:hypothetical protein